MAPRKKAEAKPEAAAPEVKKITGTVTGGSLNIRDKAGTDGKVVGQLNDGTQVEILETGKGWHKIAGGYVMAKWVKLDA